MKMLTLVVTMAIGVGIGAGVAVAVQYGVKEPQEDSSALRAAAEQRDREMLRKIRAVEQRIQEMSERIEEIRTDVQESVRNMQKDLPQQVAKRLAEGRLLGGGADAGLAGEALEERVRKAVRQAMGGKRAGAATPLGKKVTLDALAARLDWKADEAQAVADVVRDAKGRMKDLLATPRTDGTSILDDFIAELATAVQQEGGPGAQKMLLRFFGKLMREKVPGRNSSYFEEIMALRQQTEGDLKRVLGGKYGAYAALGIEDPLDRLKIPDDPLEKYIQEKLQERLGRTPPDDDRR